MMTCVHVGQLAKLVPPAAFSKVYKDECTLCFENADSEAGLDVCLSCFNGSCNEHSPRHYRKTGHALVLNVKRGRKDELEERQRKIQKVEVVVEREPEYTYSYLVRCQVCNEEWAEDEEAIGAARAVIKSVISTVSAKKRIDVLAWQEEATPCEHTRGLVQETGLSAKLQARDQCGSCELKSNLWMCLICGAIGCGRRQYDGSGGNGHGSAHYSATKHAVAVKLGTITAEGTADVHCYVCDEMRTDPQLALHLATFGIDVTGVERTEQTMAELQLEQNVKFDFSMVTEDGRQLEPLTGAGLTGLENLGNSCYLSSAVQSLFSLKEFQEQYDGDRGAEHVSQCQKDAAACFVCQMVKLTSALWSGQKKAIAPWMFKAVVTSGHPEFSTARQQDATEFLAYFFKVLQRSDPNSRSIIDAFSFGQQQLLKCVNCRDVRSQQSKSTQLSLQLSDVLAASNENVTMGDCLQLAQFLERYFNGTEVVEARCGRCGGGEKIRSVQLTSLPKYLVISLSRYVVRNWVPQKIDMSVQVPFADLYLDPYLGKFVVPSQDEEKGPVIDESVLTELISMGFPHAKCKKAIIETGNAGLEAATNWIFENMDLVVPEECVEKSIPEEMVQMLVDAGFSRGQAEKALCETDCDMERAFDWILSHPSDQPAVQSISNENDSRIYDLVSFISHKGPSVHCGHYVAHVRHPKDGWVMFNDERVVKAEPQPPVTAAEKAYLYIYQRRQ
jgi:ubiquitin carboxyl-terminal hydrolase 5/13